MKQKYLLLKNDENKELLIKEFAESDKEAFSLLCEVSYDSKEIESAIAQDKNALIGAIRTNNLFPLGTFAEQIADAIIDLYNSENDQSVELLFDDIDLLAKDKT